MTFPPLRRTMTSDVEFVNVPLMTLTLNVGCVSFPLNAPVALRSSADASTRKCVDNATLRQRFENTGRKLSVVPPVAVSEPHAVGATAARQIHATRAICDTKRLLLICNTKPPRLTMPVNHSSHESSVDPALPVALPAQPRSPSRAHSPPRAWRPPLRPGNDA